MKKLILILTLIFALALCFVACEDLGDNSKEGQSINALSGGTPETEEPTTEEPTTYIKVVDEYNSELNGVFAEIQDRVTDKSKFVFYVSEQEQHYEFKNSGQYDNEPWVKSQYTIIIEYDVSAIQSTDWYKSAIEKDRKSVNVAFLTACEEGFKNCSNISQHGGFGYQIMVSYTSDQGLLEDYDHILSMMELDYVKIVTVSYAYGLPHSIMNLG